MSDKSEPSLAELVHELRSMRSIVAELVSNRSTDADAALPRDVVLPAFLAEPTRRVAAPTERTPRIPKLRKHKASGLGVVTLAGREVYLGKHGTRECRAAYRQAIARWLAEGAPTKRLPEAHKLTVVELAAAWWPTIERRYSDPRSYWTLVKHRHALHPLVKLFGEEPATDFGPKKLAIYRADLLRRGSLCRKEINQRVQIVRKLFAFGVAQELIPSHIVPALEAVQHLRAGDGGRDSRKVGPVAWEHVEAVLPHVSAEVAALIQLQWWTGARGGELLDMRAADIDRSGDAWTYTPRRHKTERHGKNREIILGPNAVSVLRPFLDLVPLDPEAPLFSPARAEAERNIERRERRTTPLFPAHLARYRKQRRRKPKRTPRATYDSGSYLKAILRGIDAANADRVRQAMAAAVPEHAEKILELPVSALIGTKHTPQVNEAKLLSTVGGDDAAQQRAIGAVDGAKLVPHWHPHQLRHACATRLRAELGVEAARVVLGHSNLSTTEIYAEADRRKVREAMQRLG